MPIELHWDEDSEKTVVAVFEGVWSWTDANVILEELRQMTADHETVYLIVDNRRTQARHGDIIGNIRQLIRNLPTNIGLVAMVRTTTITRMMIDVLKQAGLARKIVFVSSVNEARERILRMERH